MRCLTGKYKQSLPPVQGRRRRKMKKAAVIMTLILCFSCKAPSPEFFLIEQAGDEDLSRLIIQSFVIANPPKNTIDLLKAVETYNLRTIPVESLKAGKSYRRTFYRETKQLTRNFKRGAPYKNTGLWGWNYLFLEGQQLWNHSDDYLLRTRHQGHKDYAWAYSYLTKEKRDTVGYITEWVGNIDEYFINKDN
jgi:hypothetical protein